MLGSWGKAGKAGKQVTGQSVNGEPSGPQSGGNTVQAAAFRFGNQPMAVRTAWRLFNATSLVSPMVAGRFRPQDQGSPVRRSDGTDSFGSPDLGALQNFRGSFQGPQTVRLGAQAGPSQQPAFPNTNNDSSVDFSGLGLPDVWRVKTL